MRRARTAPAWPCRNALLGLFDDYTEFGTKPLTNFIGMGYDFYGQDSWKVTRQLTLELGLRYSLWQQWRDENNAIASFQSEFYDPARAVTIDRAVGFVVPGSGDPFNGVVLPGDSPTRGGAAAVPAAGRPGAAVSRPASRLRAGSEGRPAAAARDGLRA